jgi:hypothetical protein
MRITLSAALLALCLIITTIPRLAEAQTPSLPLGAVIDVNALPSCPIIFGHGTNCFTATVSCPGTLDLPVTYGIKDAVGKSRGTIVLFSGGDGTATFGVQTDYMAAYSGAGFQSVAVVWDTMWESTGLIPNLKSAACRPATLLNFFHQSLYRGGGMCAHGVSAGSAAVAYSLANYGSADYLDNVELLAGPVFSDISEGCNHRSPKMTVCGSGCKTGKPSEGGWPDAPQYDGSASALVDHASGSTGSNSCKSGTVSGAQLSAWKNMSIVDGLGDSTFQYPQTGMAGWLCSNTSIHCQGAACQNNSSAEGQIFYKNISAPTAPYAVYRVDHCIGEEGLNTGVLPPPNQNLTGFAAISADMIKNCTLRH